MTRRAPPPADSEVAQTANRLPVRPIEQAHRLAHAAQQNFPAHRFQRHPLCLPVCRQPFVGRPDKIRVHAFSCMLGVSLLQQVRQSAAKVWPGLSMEELKQQLAGIQQVELLYPRQGQKGPPRVVSIASKQNLAQQALVQALDLEELIGNLSKPRG